VELEWGITGMDKAKKLALIILLSLIGLNTYADESLTTKNALAVLTDESQSQPETKQLFSKGVFTKKKFISDAESYTGYFLANKNLNFMNFDVLAYQVIHVETNVGCCVGSKNAFILAPKANSNLEGLQKFAKQNQCELESSSVASDLPDQVSVKLITKAKTSRLYSISCDVDR
jgi:hypothetical protein